ncbi:MAG: hypothetical protein ABI824_05780 [Acidobacteriota bacterium]
MNTSIFGFDLTDSLSWTSNGLYVAYFGLGIVTILAIVVFAGVLTRVAKGGDTYSKIDKLAR